MSLECDVNDFGCWFRQFQHDFQRIQKVGEILPGNWRHPLDGLEAIVCWCRQEFHYFATAANTLN